MKKNDYTLLLTGTINPNSNVPFLSVSNNSVRRAQYIKAIEYYLTQCSVSKLVFCENSGEQCPDTIMKMANDKGVQFEWITFWGSSENTIKIGKSYGEVELMNYAFEHSSLLKDASYFLKTTGRLTIRNFNSIVKSMKPGKNYFSTYGNKKVELVDTRLFAMNVADYKRYFADVYGYALDAPSPSIEHLYPAIITSRNIKIYSFPKQVCYEGVSGGYGLPYVTTKKEEILGSLKKTLFSVWGNKIFLEDKSFWQSDMFIPEEFWQKYFSELTGKRIVLSGAGRAGTRMYRTLKMKCKVIAWTDKNYRLLGRVYGKRITAIDSVAIKNVDYFLICVKSKQAFQDIKKSITEKGVDENKIKWAMDMIYDPEDWKVFV